MEFILAQVRRIIPRGAAVSGRLSATVAAGVLGAALVSVVQTADAQPPGVAPLYADHTELQLTLTAPMRTLTRRRNSDPRVDGILAVDGPDGATTEVPVIVTTRGNSRMDICSFPLLTLDVQDAAVADTVLAGQSELLLVTLCRPSASYEQYLYLEYLIYRMYRQVSDFGLSVRFARVRYVDSERDRETDARPAFFVEHFGGVAQRTNREIVATQRIDHEDLAADELAAVTLFQYMIGNTDWSVLAAGEDENCCHNIALFGATPAAGPGTVAVPYDFDQSGLIDASYAMPNEDLRIRSVRERLYRGFCSTNGVLAATIERFNAARPAIDQLLDDDRLTPYSRRRAQEYLERSYAIINDPDERLREIESVCRGEP